MIASIHGNITSIRIATMEVNEIISFVWIERVLGELFTEDPYFDWLLEIIIANNLKPDNPNANLNYIKKINFDNRTFIGIETSFSYAIQQ
jgi:outer membrane receptor for ferrienterochelin and colicins